MRPEIDDAVVDAVDQAVDRHTRVPVEHLTFNQRVEVLVGVVRELEETAEANTSPTTGNYGTGGASFTR
jgi:hypothetical protein